MRTIRDYSKIFNCLATPVEGYERVYTRADGKEVALLKREHSDTGEFWRAIYKDSRGHRQLLEAPSKRAILEKLYDICQ